MARKRPHLPQPLLIQPKPWYKFESIVLARITTLVGFAIAVIGTMDWSPLMGIDMSTGFNRNQVIWLGGITMAKGIADELLRRRNAVNIV